MFAPIDYLSIFSQWFFRYFGYEQKYGQYVYRLKALDELISNMYILRGFGWNLEA